MKNVSFPYCEPRNPPGSVVFLSQKTLNFLIKDAYKHSVSIFQLHQSILELVLDLPPGQHSENLTTTNRNLSAFSTSHQRENFQETSTLTPIKENLDCNLEETD